MPIEMTIAEMSFSNLHVIVVKRFGNLDEGVVLSVDGPFTPDQASCDGFYAMDVNNAFGTPILVTTSVDDLVALFDGDKDNVIHWEDFRKNCDVLSSEQIKEWVEEPRKVRNEEDQSGLFTTWFKTTSAFFALIISLGLILGESNGYELAWRQPIGLLLLVTLILGGISTSVYTKPASGNLFMKVCAWTTVTVGFLGGLIILILMFWKKKDDRVGNTR